MAFNRPSLADLVARVQGDLASRLGLTGSPLRRSVVAVLARVMAGAAHLQHGHLEYLSRQIFPDTSDTEYLERHASLFGLSRLPAAYAAGAVVLTGVDGSVVPAGTLLQRSDAVGYVTDADATIASGTATVAVTAVDAGLEGNADAGVVLAFVSPVAGVSSAATVDTGGLTNGTSAEDDASLRARLLSRLQEPPHGGSEADYVAWALAVAGVTRAWVYPLELGPGTVTVRFVRDADDGGLIPDAGAVAAVQAYIDERRPVTADVTVVAPVAVPLDFDIHLVPSTAATRAAVEAELADLLRREASPGGTLRLSQIEVAIGVAEGVTDFTVSDPVADVTHTTGQIAILGTVTWV